MTQGRTLGGSSSINDMIYDRGLRADFDNGTQRGNRGRGYVDVLPCFKRTERRTGIGDDRIHGRTGKLPVTDIDWIHPVCEAFIAGAVGAGISRCEDYNSGDHQEGVGYFQRAIYHGYRHSAARVFLHPARETRRLEVRTDARGGRILFDGTRAVGVRYVDDRDRTAWCVVNARRVAQQTPRSCCRYLESARHGCCSRSASGGARHWRPWRAPPPEINPLSHAAWKRPMSAPRRVRDGPSGTPVILVPHARDLHATTCPVVGARFTDRPIRPRLGALPLAAQEPGVAGFRSTERYIASRDLEVAVNASVTLQRPLLVKGEPGTGKTVLAYEVAQALGHPLIEWHIKSTTKAQQGLYEYDAVSRLRDGQLGDPRVHDIANYIVRGKLWDAFDADEPVVVLIDEVDKADIEFPNDLLLELDRMQFFVYETRRTVVAKHRPIVIITSNNEKELPDAFLRRCFFHYIRFPDHDTMDRIVHAHYPNIRKDLAREAMNVFFRVREVPGLKKKPATSELLDWLRLLMVEDMPVEALRSNEKHLTIPPLYGALLKNEQDVHLFERLAFLSRRGA